MTRSSWGSIRKAKPGVFRLRYPLPPDPVTGQRRQGAETVNGTKADASRRLAQLRLEHGSANPACITVGECWEQHFSRHHMPTLAPSTQRGYLNAYRANIEPAFGDVALDEVGRADIQRWLDGMTYGAARGSLAVLRTLYTYAVGAELTDHDETHRKYRIPKAASSRRVSDAVHSETELVAILRRAEGEPWEGAFILSAFGGLRREEAFGMKWEDVDFAEGYAVAHVRRGVQFIDGQVVETAPKTEGSERDAVIPAPYSARLKELFWENIGDTWLAEPYGTPPNPDAGAAAYRRWHVSKPIEYVPWKNLRNSYATMLHAHGIDLATVARLLGHTTPTTTYRHYDKPSAEQLAQAVAVLGERKAPLRSE